MKHLSWKCFWRSCIASLASIVLTLLILNAYDPNKSALSMFLHSASGIYSVLLPCTVIFVNVLPDYVSLLETRFVLHQMVARPSVTIGALYIVLDLVVTGAIAFTGLYLWALLVGALTEPVSEWMEFLRTLTTVEYWRGFFSEQMPSLFFYPAFFTSI
jgi:hypothetical protein